MKKKLDYSWIIIGLSALMAGVMILMNIVITIANRNCKQILAAENKAE